MIRSNERLAVRSSRCAKCSGVTTRKTKLTDEPMTPNLVVSIECQEKCNDSRSVASNLSQYPIQFGTFSFDRKYYKEYDKLGCELMEMWRRPASTGGGLQTCPNCQIYMRDSAHKSNSEFNSSPIRNPGEVDLKTDVQIAYNI
jgi:hypothetical protein